MSAEPLRQLDAAPPPISAPAAGVHAPVAGLNPPVDSASRTKNSAPRVADEKTDKLHANRSASERRGQLVTAAIGLALTLAMGLVVLFGYRLVTDIRASINALQAASSLQSYPEEISGKLSALCDRLEARADSGQALADLQNTVRRFEADIGQLSSSGNDSPQLARTLWLWHQYRSVIEPVVSFSGQPYVESATADTTFSPEGREYYAAAERAHTFAADKAKDLQTQLVNLAATLQHTSSEAAMRLRSLLLGGVIATLMLGAAAAWFQLMRSRLIRAQAELQETHQALMRASRQAGMAEVASNVLHNVGNVLNSVNVSASLIAEGIKKSKCAGLARAAALLSEHSHDMAAFLAGAQGKHLPRYLQELAAELIRERDTATAELSTLRSNVEHINEIVAMQQSYAGRGGVVETLDIRVLVEDSLRMNEGAFSRHGVMLIRDFENIPSIQVDKHKVLQILVNVIRNAKYACDEANGGEKRVTVRVRATNDSALISVIDTGVGIPKENLNRIFNHGFTTRRDGHGFGLHSSALAAKALGGSLLAESAGPGQGATFTLTLPFASPESPDA
jgi:signal transduction histidine kinase